MNKSKAWARAQGKRLKSYLQSQGIELSHKQALEAIAHINGSANWQTFEKSADADIVINEPAALNRLAEVSLQAALFTELPATATLSSLINELATAKTDIESGEEWREAKHRVNTIWEGVKERDFCIPPSELPPILNEALMAIAHALRQELTAPATHSSGATPIYSQLMWDWRKEAGEDLPVEDGRTYRFKASCAGGAVFTELAFAHHGVDDLALDSPQLAANFEVNQGLPCVHLYSDVYSGEALLSVFAAKSGELLVRFNEEVMSTQGHPLTGKLSLEASSLLQKARR